jgi:hypothetical protein
MHGKDEAAALQALVDFGPRYAKLLAGTRLGFAAPKTVAELKVVERLKGNMTTDFGAPDMAPTADSRPVTEADLKRFEKLIAACWAGLVAAAQAAQGHPLRKGPRGGGRELAGILEHVLQSQAAYVRSLGWKFTYAEFQPPEITAGALQAAMVAGVRASARGEVPAVGPRGGQRWSARYFVRRSTWHIVDHLNEIETRVEA